MKKFIVTVLDLENGSGRAQRVDAPDIFDAIRIAEGYARMLFNNGVLLKISRIEVTE